MLKRDAIESINSIDESREMFRNAFRIGMFSFQPTEGTGHSGILSHTAKVSDHLILKILTPKQMLQRLPIALAQVKAGNTSEKLLN